MTTIRNNVTRMLDAQGVRYAAFELPREKLGALDAAEHLGVAPELVYKTIVVMRPGRRRHLLAVVPGPHEVDLKALARLLGEKKVQIPTLKQAEKLTGLQAGGISPLALTQRPFDVVIDSSIESEAEIYLSAGQRGLNLRLAGADLVALTGARVAPITRTQDV
jgi:Cys-tRNA(Pro)/Cys-tRNA(Cys) deacylase